ncbi:MAG: Gfo/Idh/MocA family oxidoreductase [Planctomycetota bacterium]
MAKKPAKPTYATFKKPADIKVGVIGYGGAFNMGKKHLEEMRDAGMTPFAVCEIDPTRLDVATADFPGIETYDSLDKMLKHSDVNLIVHITPHNLHYSLAAKCVKAGKHVVTEKPFVVTTAEADKLIALAEKHNVMVSTYHNRHWDGHIIKAVQMLVDKQAIGDVFRAELHFGGYGMPRDWWRTSRSISGGILYDWGVHLLEYTLQVMRSPIAEVSGFAKTGHWEAKAPKGYPWVGDMNEDEATAIVRLQDGGMINLSVSELDTSGRPPIAYHGTKGSYTIHMWGPQEGYVLKTPNRKGEITEKTGKHAKGQQRLFYKNIAEHLCGQAELIITPQWARRPIHILDLARRSAEQGKALKAKYG